MKNDHKDFTKKYIRKPAERSVYKRISYTTEQKKYIYIYIHTLKSTEKYVIIEKNKIRNLVRNRSNRYRLPHAVISSNHLVAFQCYQPIR